MQNKGMSQVTPYTSVNNPPAQQVWWRAFDSQVPRCSAY